MQFLFLTSKQHCYKGLIVSPDGKNYSSNFKKKKKKKNKQRERERESEGLFLIPSGVSNIYWVWNNRMINTANVNEQSAIPRAPFALLNTDKNTYTHTDRTTRVTCIVLIRSDSGESCRRIPRELIGNYFQENRARHVNDSRTRKAYLVVCAEGHDYRQTDSRRRILLLDRCWYSPRERDHVRVDRLVLHSYKCLGIG